MLMTVIYFLIIFTFLAMAHELGHLVWAKRAGIRVYEFGLGFGPALVKFEFNKTIYSLNAIPILGYVKIAGEGEAEADQSCPKEELFTSKTPLQRIKALIAGPGMNLAAAFILLIIAISVMGVPSGISNEIGAVSPGSIAEKAGMKVGDKLMALNGKPVAKMEDAIETIHKSGGKELSLTLDREGKTIRLKAVPKLNPKLKIALLGFAPNPVYQKTNPLQTVYHSFLQVASMVWMTLVILWRLITGGVSVSDLAGPVGIAQITSKYAQSGIVSLIYFTAFLNVNIGILNLLPLPALDGGHIAFVLVEWIRRKPLPSEIVNRINYWGFIVLLGLMGLVTINDILRILR